MKAQAVSAYLLGALCALAADRGQIFFHHESPLLSHEHIDANWDTPTSENGTMNWIFNSVSSLMQRWPNTIRRNGHTIVAVTVPPGTLLYHGRTISDVPTIPDWLAFDFEHSNLFCTDQCYILSFATARKLRLAYFDGASADKMTDGPMDSQDLVIWGRARPDKWRAELERITKLCEWGKKLGLDGFVRMEFHFEIMMCDFTDGLEVVSILNLLPKARDKFPRPRRPRDDSAIHTSAFNDPVDEAHAEEGSISSFSPRFPTPPGPPEGWRGSLLNYSISWFEALHAGSWHDRAPGETRVHIDYSRLVTFYDESLTSLVDARYGVPRIRQRAANISSDDLARFMDELEGALGRDSSVRDSGIDWGSITRVIVERYGERLQLLKYLLQPSTFHNVTEQANIVRTQVLIMLSPYIDIHAVPAPSTLPAANTTWAAPIARYCSTTLTPHIRSEALHPQERRIQSSVKGTLRETCRVLTGIWVDAIDVEDATKERAQSLVVSWREKIENLMEWLDWSVWVRCEPACGPEEICYIPAWPFYFKGDDPYDMTPRCIHRFMPYEPIGQYYW